MKLLIIPSGGIKLDGITSSIFNYYRLFNRKEISTTFIDTKTLNNKNDAGLFIQEVENNGDEIVYISRNSNPIRYFLQLVKIMRKNRYDIVHVHGSSSLLSVELLAAKISGIKVRIVHSHNTTCNHKILNAILKPLFNILPTHRVACGQDAGKWLYGNKNFQVIRNGIDIKKYQFNEASRIEVRKQLGVTDKKVIGHIGNFNSQKNHSFLIDIFSELLQLDDYVLILIGDGIKKTEMESKAKNLGIQDKILFLGKRTDVPRLLHVMDIMVLPSFYEGLPLVTVEWQSAGLYTIVADTVTEEIKLTDLIVFKSLNDSPAEWAKTIDLLSNNNRSSKVSSIKNTEYDINKSADTLINLYKNLYQLNAPY